MRYAKPHVADSVGLDLAGPLTCFAVDIIASVEKAGKARDLRANAQPRRRLSIFCSAQARPSRTRRGYAEQIKSGRCERGDRRTDKFEQRLERARIRCPSRSMKCHPRTAATRVS